MCDYIPNQVTCASYRLFNASETRLLLFSWSNPPLTEIDGDCTRWTRLKGFRSTENIRKKQLRPRLCGTDVRALGLDFVKKNKLNVKAIQYGIVPWVVQIMDYWHEIKSHLSLIWRVIYFVEAVIDQIQNKNCTKQKYLQVSNSVSNQSTCLEFA